MSRPHCELTVQGERRHRLAEDIDGFVLEVATTDALGLENSIARVRVLISAALAAAKLLETGELEARLAVLELALGPARENRDAPSDGGLLGG